MFSIHRLIFNWHIVQLILIFAKCYRGAYPCVISIIKDINYVAFECNNRTIKSYTYPGDINCAEVKDEKHDLQIWANVFPNFSKWAFFTTSV